jgi:CubicO group peptidase (beta-lactamase class C family)
MMPNGFVARGYESVRDAFARGQSEDEGGGQLCIYRHGHKVVDLWIGTQRANGRPWTEDTLTTIMSCTKGATAAIVHRLAERGLIDYEAPIADYWPEFAGGGKSDARVWHVMSHSVGLPGIDPESGLEPRDLLAFERHVGVLESMAPVWTPGTSCHYHPLTYGTLLDGLVRRVTGKRIAQLLSEEISEPLGLDFWIGLPPEQDHRVAPHVPHGPPLTVEGVSELLANLGIDTSSRLGGVFLLSLQHAAELIEVLNSKDGRTAEVPAGNGISNAASLAKMYAAMIGDVEGVRLLKPETIEIARTLRTDSMTPAGDLGKLQTLGLPTLYGLGYQLATDPTDRLGPGSFGHNGSGGRVAFAHPESGVAAAYIADSMYPDFGSPDPRWAWIKELRGAVMA